MKTKKIQALSPIGAIYIALTAAVLAVPVRLYQYFNCLDPETGFWTVRNMSIPILFGLGIAAVVGAFLISYLSGNLAKPMLVSHVNKGVAVIGGITSFAFAYDTIYQVIQAVSLVQNADGQGLVYYIRSGFIPMVFQIVFAACSAIYLLFYVQTFWKGKNVLSEHSLLALCPVLWGVFRLMGDFVEPISFRNVSQLMLELLFLGFFSIFFLSFARMASNVNGQNSLWIFFFTGTCAVFFALVESFAPMFMTLIGKADELPRGIPVTDFFLLFFVGSVMVLFLREYREHRHQLEDNTEDLIPEGTMDAPAKLFTPEEPDSPVNPSVAAGSNTIPADYLSVKDPNPDQTVL